MLELVWFEDNITSLVGKYYNWFGWKMLELVWLENAIIGLVGRFQKWFGWKMYRTSLVGRYEYQNWFIGKCQNWFGQKILDLVWLEDARTGFVGRYQNCFGWQMLELVWMKAQKNRDPYGSKLVCKLKNRESKEKKES